MEPIQKEGQTKCLSKLALTDSLEHGMKTMRSVLEILFILMLLALANTALNS